MLSRPLPAGIVYRTDAATSKNARVAFTVTNGPPITYSVAPLTGSKQPRAAADFVAFVDSREGRAVFERYLGTAEPSGVRLHYVEAVPTDTTHLPRSLIDSRPHMVIVTPSPTDWNQRASDASATLSVLRVLSTSGGRELPVLAEMFLSESAKRLPNDPRLLAVSTLRSISTAVT